MVKNKQGGIYPIFAVLILISVLAAGCTAMTGKTIGENIDDANITASVKATLVADKVVNLTRIDVDTNRGVVSLNGVVESPDQRLRAAELALTSSGVKDVINNLQVR
jgi:osmotically-inducible protein OsmY